LEHPIRSLGEDLKDVTIGAAHNREDFIDESSRNFLVEKVAHAVDKNPTRFPPPERKRQAVRVGANLAEVPASPPASEPLGVAELASR